MAEYFSLPKKEEIAQHSYPEQVLLKNKALCIKKRYEANRNLQDSGLGWYSNAANLWEDRVIEINQYLDLSRNSSIRELEFDDLLQRIEAMLEGVRQDYRDDYGLRTFENSLKEMLRQWRNHRILPQDLPR